MIRIHALVLLAALLSPAACSSGDEFEAGKTGGNGGGATGGKSGTGGAATDAGAGGQSGDAGGDASLDAGDPNGAACNEGTTCSSGHCVDGFCCDVSCTAACMSCKVPGNEGTCSPYGEGVDPEGDCAQPDSGVGACEQTCDGKGACVSCGLFKCGATGLTCMNTCGGDVDCKDTAWCNASTCESKKDNGLACQSSSECKSGTCALQTCCETACEAPASCVTGKCLCSGVECDANVKCTAWYQDGDKDGYGSGSKKLACDNAQPAGYVKDSSDCYDLNKDAFPGQTSFFKASRGDGSFDYDCDTQETAQYPDLGGKTCTVCNCPAGGCYVRFGCNSTCPSGLPTFGYQGAIACGQPGTLLWCSDSDPGTGCTVALATSADSLQPCR